MNKLYHIFYVTNYKGGELHSYINYTLEDMVEEITDWCFWDDLKEYIVDEECVAHLSGDEFYQMSELDLLNIIPDNVLENIVNKILYPGNIYAFDEHSDYQVYTTNSKGELIKINPVKEEEFFKLLRNKLAEYYG